MIGRRLSHYRVISELGAGGMGQVYEAEDLDLRRHVALKVLPAEVAQDEERLTRFRREAQALAALNHPSIVTVYSVEQDDGIHFLTMELVSGTTLDRLIPTQGMPLDRFLDLALPLADAVTAAHERGITHRDLKPANIMVTEDGRPKILDFGLAKLGRDPEESVSGEASTEMMTREGSILGTMPYMSPEQIQGKPVDQRSDIFALGTIFYEMLAGHRPFHGETSPDLMSAILRETPPAVDEVIPALPHHLGRIIQHCLEKDPAERFQTARDVGNELKSLRREITAETTSAGPSPSRQRSRRRRLTIGALSTLLLVAVISLTLNIGRLRQRLLDAIGPSPIRSLAVLPIENLSGAPGQKYLAEGMTRALIDDLSQISALKVISRASVLRYRKTKEPPEKIARELGVAAIVEGAAGMVGGQVRARAELLNGATARPLWSKSYVRDVSDLPNLQREIVRGIAHRIAVPLTTQETRRLQSAKPVNSEAYQAYLKGMQAWAKATPAAWDAALGYFHLALAKDSDYAPAYVGIAAVWGGRQQMGIVPPSEATPRSKAAILKAIEIDSNLASAHATLANINAWNDWDWKRAEAEFKRALELNPRNTLALAYYSHLLTILGRTDEAMVQIHRALDIDPFDALLLSLYGVDLIGAHRYDEAIAESRKALAIVPNHPVALTVLSKALWLQGKKNQSIAELSKAAAAEGDQEVVRALAQGRRAGGARGAVLALADLLVRRSHSQYVNAPDVAGYYLEAGDKALALDWLEKGFAERDPNMPYIVLPVYRALRHEPRFQALVKRMHLTL